MKRIYLDYAATTPIDPTVKKAVLPYFGALPAAKFGNPGSLHFFGQKAIAALDCSRETISKSINAEFRELIFASSATEANNLAIKGVLKALKPLPNNNQPKLIISSIEHESIIKTAKNLENSGVRVVYLPINSQGFIDLKDLEKNLDENTVLISIMVANNEIGSIQSIAKISKIIKEFRQKSASFYPLFHTDAAQAFQFLNCSVRELDIDLMTLSSHKIYGPKGSAALFIKNSITQNKLIKPIISGGEQEFGLRSGTENIPAIIGFAKAIELADKNREKERARQFQLLQYFYQGIKKIYPKAKINGPLLEKSQKNERLPNILNLYFPGINSEGFLTKLDLSGIAASSASACSSRSAKASHVLKALNLKNENVLKSSIRFSIGKFTTKQELNLALKIIKKII